MSLAAGYEGLDHLAPLFAQLTTAFAPMGVRVVPGTQADAENSVEPGLTWYEADDWITTLPNCPIEPDDGDAVGGYRETWLVSIRMPSRARLRQAVLVLFAKLLDLLGPLAFDASASKPIPVSGDSVAARIYRTVAKVVLRGPIYREYFTTHQPSTVTVGASLISATGDAGSPSPMPPVVIS